MPRGLPIDLLTSSFSRDVVLAHPVCAGRHRTLQSANLPLQRSAFLLKRAGPGGEGGR